MVVATPPRVRTSTSEVPAPLAGVRAVMSPSLWTTISVAHTPPKVTDVVVRRPLPVSSTNCPPAVGPLSGLTTRSVGGITKVKPPVIVEEPTGLVTTTSTVPAV